MPFKKGQIAWNKGIPNSGFKKGHTPWNKGKKLHYPAWNKGLIGFSAREQNGNWKGGKIKDYKGYVLVRNKEHPFCNSHGYVFEHRIIVEKQIGRYLHKWEVCHHINGVKDDNRKENLQLFEKREHDKKHKRGEFINAPQNSAMA